MTLEWQGSEATALAPHIYDKVVFKKNSRLLSVSETTIPTVPVDENNLLRSLD